MLLWVVRVALANEPRALYTQYTGYTKYSMGDSFAKSCYSIYEQFAASHPLEVGASHTSAHAKTQAYADTGLCGVNVLTGERQAFLWFDMTDFSADAISSMKLVMTASDFPLDAVVDVSIAACSLTDEAIDWLHRPTLAVPAVCTWTHGESTLCDLTEYDPSPGVLCLALASSSASREPVRFYSSHAPIDFVTRSDTRDLVQSTGRSRQLNWGTVAGYESSAAPRLYINSTACAARLPNYSGPGC